MAKGRKTKLTDDMIKAIYTALKKRMSWNRIAALVGVDPRTLRNWRFHTRRMRPRQPSQAYLNTRWRGFLTSPILKTAFDT